MARSTIMPTGVERFFSEDEIIVSKTDTKGIITYANQIFLKIAGYTEVEVIGQPHNMIRHPDTPGGIFKLLWNRIESGEEVFAYVCNMAKNGDHYWVLAHVSPSFDASGRITGYHSNRRVPEKRILDGVKAYYTKLHDVERQAGGGKAGAAAGLATIQAMLDRKGLSYDEYIHGL
ncbi:MAG: PAS domain-containing protein [Rhodospirillum sp.]|nr:PAS domain-containing protein [Rhodospirillum sp.]MCF8488930.1 PAS domain-containing protein [Rhodospirillum sp.]MCF8498986.1 PAS domain-containing protein [Rhodospirillum sp.]